MFICSSEAIDGNPEVLSPPSTIVAKRLPDRNLSDGKRLIADLRESNMFTTKKGYRKMAVPDIQVLAKRVDMLKRRSPGKLSYARNATLIVRPDA